MNETEKAVVEAIHTMHRRLAALELAQQFMVFHLSAFHQETARALSGTFKIMTQPSPKVEIDSYVLKYLAYLGKLLDGNLDMPIWGLEKLPAPEPGNLPVWLKAIIEGAKRGP